MTIGTRSPRKRGFPATSKRAPDSTHTAKFAEANDSSFVSGNCGFYFILDQMLYRNPPKASIHSNH
jgi:hypothetical protein